MNLKGNKAITLVALIITIIVLLILAGVTLNMVLGENGLINKAQSSEDKYKESATNEQALLNEIENYIAQGWTGTQKNGADVNAPQLSQGMIPIKWNGSNWVITTKDDPDWYAYIDTSTSGNTDKSKWANVMLSDGKYSNVTPIPSGKTAAKKDTVVEIGDLGSMFVWIPRYAYNIKSGVHTNSQGEIQIEFLKGIAKTSSQGNTFANIKADGSIDTTATAGNDKWLVHPAFLNNTTIGGWDRELEGIWVAKFEASSTNPSANAGGGDVTTLNVKVLPNTISWRYIREAYIFTNCLAMKNSGNIYGLATTSEPHEIKNTEWGAVAYLAHSKYGRNRTEISHNDNTSFYTGGNNYTSNIAQSSTGNVYGIYDLNGCSYEFTASGLTSNVNSTFGSSQTKYVNRYNTSIVATQYGDAVYETPAWFNDFHFSLADSTPFFLRDATCSHKTSGGAFSYFGWHRKCSK